MGLSYALDQKLDIEGDIIITYLSTYTEWLKVGIQLHMHNGIEPFLSLGKMNKY